MPEYELTKSGVLRLRQVLRNDGDVPFRLAELACILPVPTVAAEVLDLTGRWCRERHPQRRAFDQGIWLRQTRHGRTGHDAPLLLVAGTPGFGFRHGEVWGIHLAWSGDASWWAERLPDGSSVLGAAPSSARSCSQPGEEYATPWVYAAWSDEGLDGLSAAAAPLHPLAAEPSAAAAAGRAQHLGGGLLRPPARPAVGAGRHGRRARRRAVRARRRLVPPPARRHRRARRLVRRRGRLAGRAASARSTTCARSAWSSACGSSPRWSTPTPTSPAPTRTGSSPRRRRGATSRCSTSRSRRRTRTSSSGSTPCSPSTTSPTSSGTTTATSSTPHARRRRWPSTGCSTSCAAAIPGVEIESCSSGGARVDLGILARTDRVWASDTNDALERQSIQRWTQLLLPPELVGSHVGPPKAHTTGRTHDLSFRAATALFGHFGIEWDIASASDEERAELAEWIARYKRLRRAAAQRRGRARRPPRPRLRAARRGRRRPQSEALFCFVALATSASERPGRRAAAGARPRPHLQRRTGSR